MSSHNPLTYGLTHFTLTVTDLDRTLRFYTAVFDMEVMYNEANMIQLTTPGSHDILVFEKGIANPATGGIAHLGFRLKEPAAIEAVHEKIRLAGGTAVKKGEFVPGSPFIFFKDPDGYLLEVWYELLPEEG